MKTRFSNLHYRFIIGALVYYEPCCTRPDICFAVNKLVKFTNNPGVIHLLVRLTMSSGEAEYNIISATALPV